GEGGDLGLVAGGAAQPPEHQRDAVGQFAFDRGTGVEVAEDGGAEGVPLVGVFAREDGSLGAEAVLDGVEAGSLLAGVGARAGGVVGHEAPRGRVTVQKPRLPRAAALWGERLATKAAGKSGEAIRARLDSRAEACRNGTPVIIRPAPVRVITSSAVETTRCSR